MAQKRRLVQIKKLINQKCGLTSKKIFEEACAAVNRKKI